MDYKLYLTAWIAFLVTLIALKLFGMFSGESDFVSPVFVPVPMER